MRYTAPDGRRRETGIGSYPEVSLASARTKARLIREQARNGLDPLAERERLRKEAAAAAMRQSIKERRASFAVYAAANPGVDADSIFERLDGVRKITNNQVGIIELAEDLDIETLTEIFIRVNSAGATLSQADFAMSKIAANETYGGNMLQKAIDYFCHLSVAPEFTSRIEKGDAVFAASEYFPKLKWLKDVNDDLYDPSYTDMLRVAFTSQFGRGKLQDLN